MQIELLDLKARDLATGYRDDREGGAFGIAGKLGRFYVRGDRKYARIVVWRRIG